MRNNALRVKKNVGHCPTSTYCLAPHVRRHSWAQWVRPGQTLSSKRHVSDQPNSCVPGFRNAKHAPPRVRHLLHSAKCPTTLSTCARHRELATSWDPGQNVTSVFGYAPALQVLATRTMRRRALGIYSIAQNVRRHCRHVLATMSSPQAETQVKM